MSVRLRSDFGTGTLAQACQPADTVLVSNQFTSLPVVSSPSYMPMTLDPNAVFGAPEVVWVTTHASSSASVTVTRQAEDSSTNPQRVHNAFEQWVVAATSSDFAVRLPSYTSATLPGSQDVGSTVFETDTNQPLVWNGTAWMTMLPVGVVMPYIAASAPNTGGGTWLVCDGSAVSRTTYATLFGLIGTTYGTGNGSTTFNLPDLRGRTPVGSGTGSGLTARTLGAGTGEESHLLVTGEMPSHNHTVTDPNHNHAVNDPGHGHVFVDPGHVHGPIAGAPPGNGGYYAFRDDLAANGLSASPAERATFSVSTSVAVTGGAVSAAASGVTTAVHPTGISLAATGGGAVHNNMQPFAVLNFIIKAI